MTGPRDLTPISLSRGVETDPADIGSALVTAICLRLLTAKGQDTRALKTYLAAAGLSDLAAETCDTLSRRLRTLRVEFEQLGDRRVARSAPAEPPDDSPPPTRDAPAAEREPGVPPGRPRAGY